MATGAESSGKRNAKRKLELAVIGEKKASPSKTIRGESQYKFKILLPNGATIDFNLINRRPKMAFECFISLVKDEYYKAWRRVDSMKAKRKINWSNAKLFVEDGNLDEIRDTFDFDAFEPSKCHILKLYDGSCEVADTFENMWDLTPDIELLKELPEDYTFETALADLIDNSLQAVWTNDENERRLVRVNIAESKISIFDTGPGMDGTDENCIVKWGKMGASLHRAWKARGIGGKPPYLMPYFGMFGYGGPIASMHLGRRALVSSKTKESKKVYTLHLEREALTRCSDAELSWRTNGGIRVPSKEETMDSPHGSFTKVEILEPKLKILDIEQLRCKLKDIYFPYIQCDEVSSTGKTTTPIEFQVNGVNLAEVAGGEVAITNLHSCNGPDFVLQLHLSSGQDRAINSSPGARTLQEANARLKFVYFPITEVGESIDLIMDKLKFGRSAAAESNATHSRVSIRRLGRLLPDARWAWLPLMDLRQRKGEKAHLLKIICLRVKCFIDTDAGFSPMPSKADLAHQNPFTIALKGLGPKMLKEEQDVNVEIRRDGRPLTPLQLERDYQHWLLKMHDQYDAEKDCGVDQPCLLVSPQNKKSLGISADVARVHKVIKRKGVVWESGQKVRLLKGAYAGIHNNDMYATIEYFLIDGLQGDPGGDARLICRPLAVPDKRGSVLAVDNMNTSLDVCSSLSIPIAVIDSKKCLPVTDNVWDQQLEKIRQKSPSMVELLEEMQCQELGIHGVLPINANAGQVPPKEIVAVVRPASCVSSSMNLVQKDIVKNGPEMVMEVKFRCKAKNLEDVRHIYSARVAPSSRKGFQGLYIFELGCKFPNLFQNAGVYTFSFYLPEPSCKCCEKKVHVDGSSEVGKWILLNPKEIPQCVRVGSLFPTLSVACYDIYNNRIPFESIPEVMVKCNPSKIVSVCLKELKTKLSSNKLTLNIEGILILSTKLDEIRPDFKSFLVISAKDKLLSVSIPYRVTPGSLKHIAVQSQNNGSFFLPGSVIKTFKLEMFDAFHNHVKEGLEVELSMDGLCTGDQLGLKRKVDGDGCLDLSGLLKVTAGYGKIVSLSVLCGNEAVFKEEFQTEKRELRIVSGVPEFCAAGSQLDDLTFEIVNSKGDVDMTIHDDDKRGQSHTLVIKSDLISTGDSVRYAFRQGRCTVPAVALPQKVGIFSFVAAHSRYSELEISTMVTIVAAPYLESDEIRTPFSDGRALLVEGSSPIKHERNHLKPILKIVEELECEVYKYGSLIGNHEEKQKVLNHQKTVAELVLSNLQASLDPDILNNPHSFLTKEEVMRRIERTDQSAASVVCSSTKDSPCHEPSKNFIEDVVGLVALIGTVSSNELSRTLADYLGEDQMLALICRSFKVVCAFEKYQQDGTIDYKCGLHATAAALGKSIDGRFLVMCLDGLRPYTGKLEGSDPQRKLALPIPTLPCGNIPAGFLGYAVNMVNLDDRLTSIRTNEGNGLRETLLYQLFGKLQVYRTRKDMMQALTCIDAGAVSLDGGILKESGVVSFGCGNPAVCFPVSRSRISNESMESLKQIEEKKSELDMIKQWIGKLDKDLKKYRMKFVKRMEMVKLIMDQLQASS